MDPIGSHRDWIRRCRRYDGRAGLRLEKPVPKRVAEMAIMLFEVAVEIYAIGHRLTFLRWRREYERSIDRLIRTHHAGM
jgi:hypothetical protein